ncbi:14061_t:CDS:2 [Acaulospora morrowiae]|uniref:14061_t:CDS:1 n=1 Tax=Acaulospora morrowiae TaxID=94023 RepID=A0A9N9FMK1_9GLOM|nr:14061_t:CDS:2 [Acaulospora morrowiae]
MSLAYFAQSIRMHTEEILHTRRSYIDFSSDSLLGSHSSSRHLDHPLYTTDSVPTRNRDPERSTIEKEKKRNPVEDKFLCHFYQTATLTIKAVTSKSYGFTNLEITTIEMRWQ